MGESKKQLWRAAEITPTARPFTQQLNPKSLFRAAPLSRLAGMSRDHAMMARVAARFQEKMEGNLRPWQM